MREIFYIKTDTIATPDRTIFRELRSYGRVDEDGVFRLIACCGKRFPARSSGEGLADGKNLLWKRGTAA